MNTNDMLLCYNMMHRLQEEEIRRRPPGSRRADSADNFFFPINKMLNEVVFRASDELWSIYNLISLSQPAFTAVHCLRMSVTSLQ